MLQFYLQLDNSCRPKIVIARNSRLLQVFYYPDELHKMSLGARRLACLKCKTEIQDATRMYLTIDENMSLVDRMVNGNIINNG